MATSSASSATSCSSSSIPASEAGIVADEERIATHDLDRASGPLRRQREHLHESIERELLGRQAFLVVHAAQLGTCPAVAGAGGGDPLAISASRAVQHAERHYTFGAGREHGRNGSGDLIAGHLDAGVRDHDRPAGTDVEWGGPVDHRQQPVLAEPSRSAA